MARKEASYSVEVQDDTIIFHCSFCPWVFALDLSSGRTEQAVWDGETMAQSHYHETHKPMPMRDWVQDKIKKGVDDDRLVREFHRNFPSGTY